MNEENLKRELGALEKVTFLGDLLEKQNQIRNLLDVRANIVIGFTSASIVILATLGPEKIGTGTIFYLILAILAFSLLLSIIALKPPHWSTKKNQQESIFYHHHINSMSSEEYQKEIHRVLANEDSIYDAYIRETYNLTRYSNIPRKQYLYASIRVLIYGFGLVILIYAIYYLLGYSTWVV